MHSAIQYISGALLGFGVRTGAINFLLVIEEHHCMTYYLVMDAWNCVVARFDDEAAARLCARTKGGFIVYMKVRGF